MELDTLTNSLHTLVINDVSKQCCKDAFLRLEQNVIEYVKKIATNAINDYISKQPDSTNVTTATESREVLQQATRGHPNRPKAIRPKAIRPKANRPNANRPKMIFQWF